MARSSRISRSVIRRSGRVALGRLTKGEILRRLANRRVALWLALALVGMLVAIATVAGGASAQHVATGGAKTPAIGAHPKYQYAGNYFAQPNLSVFGCQTRTIGGAPASVACYGPDQIQTAYGFKPLYQQGYTGAGRTIVIVDAYGSPTIGADLALFDTAFDLPTPNFQIVNMPGLQPFDPNDPNQVNWSGEVSLDVQWAHAVAPGANIVLVVAKSNDDADILAATQYAYDHNLGDVLSQSFGEAEQCMNADLLAQQHKLFEAMTGKGWTLFASAGDSGSDQPGCGPNDPPFQAASTPASDPNVTGVGGTQLNATPVVLSPPPPPRTILDFGGQYIGETAWNENATFGAAGGGGLSVVYKRTDFQAPVVKDSKARAVPDVAYNAAIDGGVITFWGVPFGVGNGFVFGGTSAGSPQWSGLAAITDQIAGNRVGNINKTLYFLGKKSQSTYFHDVVTGSIGAFSAGPGYDEATGWGSPIASAIAPAIAKPGNG
jgi:subtilase family serine protease